MDRARVEGDTTMAVDIICDLCLRRSLPSTAGNVEDSPLAEFGRFCWEFRSNPGPVCSAVAQGPPSDLAPRQSEFRSEIVNTNFLTLRVGRQ